MQNFTFRSVLQWQIEVTTCNGRETADLISIKRGILQGDSFLRHAVYHECESHRLVLAKHRGL